MRYSTQDIPNLGRCFLMDTGQAVAAFSLDLGPRVVAFHLKGKANVMYEQPADADYLTTPEGWRVHAGTRLWMAPESGKTYFPDNAAIEYDFDGQTLTLRQTPDPWLNIRKTIGATFTGDTQLRLDYSITNLGEEAITCSAWAVSSCVLGGVLSVPFTGTTGKSNPDRFISLWNDTRLSDPRIRFLDDSIQITPLVRENYLKLGIRCPEAEVEYALDGQLFIKKFSNDGPFEDNDVNLEVFCCDKMIEIETLGKKTTIGKGQEATHSEIWTLEERKESIWPEQ